MDKIELSEKKYKETLENSPNAIIIYSNEVCTFINKSGKKLFKAKKDSDIIDKKIIDFVDIEFKTIFKNYLSDNEKMDVYKEPLECKFIACDDSIIYADIVIINTYDKDSVRHVVLFNDKTQKKILDNRTEFFIDMSHELKTPLNIVLSSMQMIDMYHEKGNIIDNSQKLHYYNKIIKQNCYTLLKIINNLIDINKIECGEFDVNIFNYDIVKVIEHSIESISDIVNNNGIKFIFNKQIDEKVVACDKDKIERIIFNLISNSIKFTEPGGQIIMSLYTKSGYVCISVKDTGIGISKDNQKYIFDRYHKGIKDKNYSGSGLGLSIVKSMVDFHNGEIILESEEGLGTNFIVKIPDVTVRSGIIEDAYLNTERFNIEFANLLDA